MAPKSLPPAAKQALILQWIQKSGVAHTFKDLEKALPSVASINGMAVKDYIQALSDDNAIRVEKIGSGNWYWCFLSDEKIRKEQALTKSLEERDKVSTQVEELQVKVDEAGAAREEDETSDAVENGMDRKGLTLRNESLTREMEALRTELASYSENDPMEVEKRRGLIKVRKGEAVKYTDYIESLEAYVKKTSMSDKQSFIAMKQNWYGEQFDDDEGGLREL